MKVKTRIIFRADGNSQIGLGHVVRSLALAEMLRHDFECVFAIQAPSVELQQQIRETCEELIILPACQSGEEKFNHELDAYIAEDVVVVLDGYHFDTVYQNNLKQEGVKLVCIDDIHAYHFVADVVISHVLGLSKEQFSAEKYTRFCLGAEYALLRKNFLNEAKQFTCLSKNDSEVFICLGGADPLNQTLDVLKYCVSKLPNLKYSVVVGAANPHKQTLSDFAYQNSIGCDILTNLSADEMSNYMQESSTAITSASSVAYEYLCTHGILYLVQTAGNQSEVYDYLVKNNLALPLTSFGKKLSPDAQKTLIRNGCQIFDGNQASRFLKIFKELSA